ncbi:transposase [Streptomyces huasconensis]|uniref:transposase n=1 Tax=Streptomyces TaxID=1883 RepID=UPI0038B561DE
MSLLHHDVTREPLGLLSAFRAELYASLTARADALFELTDAMLCADGPVKTLVGLALAAEHRRGHGALYAGLKRGRLEVDRLRRAVAAVPLPKAADGRLGTTTPTPAWPTRLPRAANFSSVPLRRVRR